MGRGRRHRGSHSAETSPRNLNHFCRNTTLEQGLTWSHIVQMACALHHVTTGMTTLGRSLLRLSQAQHERMSKRFDAVAKALGKRIRVLRKGRGWSQEHLADEANMHRTYMWGIERGVRNPSLRHLAQIADALGVTLATLLTFDEHGAHK